MTAAAASKQDSASIIGTRPAMGQHIFCVIGPSSIEIREGTTLREPGGNGQHWTENQAVRMPESLKPGTDYAVLIDPERGPVAVDAAAGIPDYAIGGFHYAPAGNALARNGGTEGPAINPMSCWDAGFRPSCADPRGMALVTMEGAKRFWADIYLLGGDHIDQGTSRHGATIADGRSLPQSAGGGRHTKLDYATAVAILAHHGKQLLGAEEFFAAAYGVAERRSRDEEPEKTGEPAGLPFVSKAGLFDATGSMWQWGTDGDPDNPRASVFGGSWLDGGDAGSRQAVLDYWPDGSYGGIGARGRCDHLES